MENFLTNQEKKASVLSLKMETTMANPAVDCLVL